MKEKEEYSSIFLHPGIKAVILNGIPVLIGVLGLTLSCEINSDIKAIIAFSVVLLTVASLVAIYYYGKNEKVLMEKVKNLSAIVDGKEESFRQSQNKNKVTVYIVSTLDKLLSEYAKNINTIANDICSSGRAEKKDWNIQKLCETICKSCCEMLQREKGLDENNGDIGVSFIHCYVNNENEASLKMIAHSSQAKPNVYMKEEKLKDCVYYYAGLIRENNPEITAMADKDKVFHSFRKKNDRTDLSKYSQYIAYPIIGSDNKSLGILQIVIKNDLRIRETDLELERLAEAYIGPFARLVLLVLNLDKGLYAIPKNKEKGEG